MVSENFSAPIISNVTTKPYSTKDEAISLLKDQLVKPVKYKQSIEAIAKDVDLFIEFGNGNVLKGLNKRIAKDIETLNVADMESLNSVIETLKA
jgi:[acyl-carrier-protein] S-malonyltransferase